LGFRVGPSRNFEFRLCKHEMICLRTGKYKDPPISHRFFFNGEFSPHDEKKGLQTVERIFS
jgi:hypothetical protein